MTMCGRLLMASILGLAVIAIQTCSVEASEAKLSQTVQVIHRALSGKKLALHYCNEQARTKTACQQLMHDFVATTDVDLISPDWVASGPNDENFREAFGQCISGPASDIYQMNLYQTPPATAHGPFAVYHQQSRSGSALRHREVVRLFGYHPEDPSTSYDWSQYDMFDLADCRRQSIVFFYHRGLVPLTATESLDGIVKLRGRRYIFALDQISPDASQYEVRLVDLDQTDFGDKHERLAAYFVAE